jgi:hypothetical protein
MLHLRYTLFIINSRLMKKINKIYNYTKLFHVDNFWLFLCRKLKITFLTKNWSITSDAFTKHNTIESCLCIGKESLKQWWSNILSIPTPSYLCDLLPSLVRDVTNSLVRNRNDYTVPRCRLSLYQYSIIPSVIDHWNNLDNDTRNTRTSDSFKINLKSKVVLAKFQGNFLVGDRRHNILYARLRRSCSSLKNDLFRSNIITDSRCVCGFTREDASHFLLNCRLYIEQRTVLFNFLHHHNFRRDIKTLLFGDS